MEQSMAEVAQDQSGTEGNEGKEQEIPAEAEAQKQEPAKKSRAKMLTKKHGLFQGAEFFHTRILEPFIRFQNGDRLETCSIDSASFELHILRECALKTGAFPSEGDIKQVKHQLKCYAMTGRVQDVHVRSAAQGDDIFIDLCDHEGNLVKITADGWEVVKEDFTSPRFVRSPGMLPLPIPTEGGSISDLANHVNVKSEEDFILTAGFILGAMNPCGPYCLMFCLGPQGSAKSTLMKRSGDLIDPSEASVASLPKSERDLFIAATRTHFLRFDNISKLTPALADAFCRLCTEGVFRTRKLYKNTQEIILRAMRPSMFTGISGIVQQNDLLDRAICITLPNIPAIERKTADMLQTEWEAAKPSILGAFYDALSMALRNKKSTKLENAPRMADFAHWVVAAEKACPWEEGAFLKAYERNRNTIIDEANEGDPVFDVITRLMKGQNIWQGPPTELFGALQNLVPQETKKCREWPKGPAALSNRLMRLSGFLSNKGIDVEKQRRADKRLIVLSKSETTGEYQNSSESGKEMIPSGGISNYMNSLGFQEAKASGSNEKSIEV